MARGRYRGGKPTGRRHFSNVDDLKAEAANEQEEEAKSGSKTRGEPGELPPSDSESGSEEEEEEVVKNKGVAGIIETANLNAKTSQNTKAKNISLDDLDEQEAPQLSRREREAIQAQKAKERYWKLAEQGKTEQARIDLDRLAIIKKQRAEAAAKREEEKKAKEERASSARGPVKK
ncbi:hypothetical protein CYMTET_26131 [Cymbomonas tetramitiformis]|uniref:Casein kinase substrate phosphoprotein PP28 domain-containing protein n=1 Tax=Cymbomonas tetramitiformis TaxID=36881 RepID=A0AAE0FT52_9CHLO|nr:hypothetical protein CYMTET_26131 [Cymbomonas tetramitiformis]